jgi:glycosyltransferase involved in cell wall biosynthesis
MKRIIVSLYAYANSGADGIRVAGYIKGFIKLGYDVVLVTTAKEKIELKDDHLSIVLVGRKQTGPKVICKLVNSWRLVKETKLQYKKGDAIFFYSTPILGFLFGRKRKLFYEETEVPMHGGNESFSRRLMTKFYLWTTKRATGLFVISNALKNYYIEQGVSPDKICVSNMTVDLSRFEGIEKQSVEHRYIAYCGSISNHKDGVDTLIKAFARVSKNLLDIKLYLMGLFSIPEEEKQDKELARSLNIADKVVFCGLVSSRELPQMLKNADCLVLARPENKQAKYGFPTKLGEYLLTENPVVVTSVGDIPLFLKNRESAYLAEPNNIDDIAAKIEEALTSPNAVSIGKMGAQVARLNFNSDIETKKVVDFIISNE